MSTDAESDFAPLGARRGLAVARVLRLASKELREILRDRRTIFTLLLMPLLLYPLLSVLSRQLLSANRLATNPPPCRVAVRDAQASKTLEKLLDLAMGQEQSRGRRLGHKLLLDRFETYIVGDKLEERVRDGTFDIGLEFASYPELPLSPDRDVHVQAKLIYVEDAALGPQAAVYFEDRFALAGELFLSARLRKLHISQTPVPFEVEREPIEDKTSSRNVPLITVIPLILILMTITGAVYPAIDLTAGERERGTMEILVAAPVPRMGLLCAKYIAVFVVAMLTALFNLVMMAITLAVSGFGPLLFGPSGLSIRLVAQVVALLVLLAAFFSAVLLALTSFARSFKEAQAYLVPLMLLSITPGVLALMPDVHLSKFTAVVPLVNIVLLARDLLQGKLDTLLALAVVASTLLYALGALALAARIFGAEAVLYSAQSGLREVVLRPRQPQAHPTAAGGLMCLALLFPAMFLAQGAIAIFGSAGIAAKVVAAGVVTALLFVALPSIAAWMGHVPWRRAFRWHSAPLACWLGALLLGLSMWALMHELILLQHQWGIATLSPELLKHAAEQAKQLQLVPPWLLVLTLGVLVGACEELFFRGYLFAALRPTMPAGRTIWTIAVLFGLFHLIALENLTFERLLPTTLLGAILGWIAARSGSVLPGIVMHATNNGLLMLLVYYAPWLRAQGIGMQEEEHIPLKWLALAAAVALLGAAGVWWGGRSQAANTDPAAAGGLNLDR